MRPSIHTLGSIRLDVAFICAAIPLAVGCSASGGASPGDQPLNGAGGSGWTPGGAGMPNVAVGGGAMNAPPFNAANCPVPIFQKAKCTSCHDGRGTAGTPMGLVTYEDFLAPSHTNPANPVYKQVAVRLHDSMKPMPPTGPLDAPSIAAVDDWVAHGAPDCGFAHRAGAPGAGGAAPIGAGGAPPMGAGGTTPIPMPGAGGAPPAGGAPSGGAPPGAGGGPPIDASQYLSPDGKYFIKEPPGTAPLGPDAPNAEYCFNIVAHGKANTPLGQDSSKFTVAASEFYHEFDYKVPYPKTMVALSTKPIIDNNQVLHHWLLFHIQSDTGTDGASMDEIGLQIGKELVTGWAPGGDPLIMPDGVGLEMPKVGGFLAMETHYFNNTGAPAQDRSGVRICMTSQIPPNVATLTWLGTEGISIPANQTASNTGTCTPGGGRQTGDIHLLQASPHMHKLGTHMKTVINRKGGGSEVVVDNPFAFNDQRAYAVTNLVHPGDTLTTTCTWQNTTGAAVGFGTSTTAEMCYNFVISYPAHSLPNPQGGGIEGSSNMCLR